MKSLWALVWMGLAAAGYAGEPAPAAAAGTNGPAGTAPAAAGKERRAMEIKEQRSGAWTPELTADERATLFAIAEDTLQSSVNGTRDDFSFSKYKLTPKLREPMATFVTLKMGGRLRGCIGSLAPEAPLYESVHDNADNAAMHDFRFRPVTPRELPLLEVDISVLSPIVPIASVKDFKLGEHGIIIEKGARRAVYLPEVAVEQGWTVEETLSSLSEKAGMDPDAWRSGARFKVFSSVVLSK